MDISLAIGLFSSAFLAATLFPAQSEISLAVLVVREAGPIWLMLGIATAGNTLGSMVNWLLGRWCMQYRQRGWFPVGREALARAESWYRRFGRWTLLLSWAPVIGDPLTLAAGMLREPLWSFTLLVACAKFTRYVVVVWLALSASSIA